MGKWYTRGEMTIGQIIKIRANDINWSSGMGPVGADWYETFYGIQPVPHDHAPSLKRPQHVKAPTAQDGWRQGDSKMAIAKAVQDLAEVHKRLRRQIGKPEIAHTAQLPVFPQLFNYLP